MTTFRSLRVMPEYGSSGIWVNEPSGPFRHAMISHDELGLDVELSKRFEHWITRYWQILDSPENLDIASFNEEGRRLAKDLKGAMGPDTEVLFVSLESDGSLADEEIIAV